MKKHDIIPVKVEKFALDGRGIAFAPVPIFIDDVCVGDEAMVGLTKKKASFGEGRMVEIIKGGPDRIAARCKHFGACGGCTWQFLAHDKQLIWKEKVVRETLEHLGGFTGEFLDSAMRSIVGCDDPWFYRNKMEWSFSVDARGDLSAGFHLKRMHYDTVNVDECFLQSLKSVEILKAIREFFVAMHKRGEDVVYNMRNHRGLVRSVFVREGKRTGEYMVIAQTSAAPFDTDAFVKIFDAFPEIVSVIHMVVHDAKGSPTRLEERVLKGVNFYREEMRVGDGTDVSSGVALKFNVKPLAFFQPNSMMAEKIYGEVISLLRSEFSQEVLSKMRAYDLYCGTGTIGIVLSKYVESVIGIELNENAVESAKENAELNSITNISFLQGDVKLVLEKMASEATNIDVMTVDPPRSGMEEKVLQQIVAVGPKAIAYVSCNPATFSRDAKLLSAAGYIMKSVRPFDQFPQTAHIETVALFLKA